MPLFAGFLRDSINDLTLKASLASTNDAKNSREISEAYEMVANFEFYSGKYNSAAFNYEESYYHRHFFPTDRENAFLCLMAATCHFKLGDYVRSYAIFERAVEQSKLSDARDLEAIALTNMGVIDNVLSSSKAAMDKSLEALTITNELSLTHPHLDNSKYTIQHKRVYIGIMIRAGNYSQAELTIKEFKFSPGETAVLIAGCKFLSGQYESAKSTLDAYCEKLTPEGLLYGMLPHVTKRRRQSDLMVRFNEDIDREEHYFFTALVYYNLGVLASANARYEESVSNFTTAIKMLSHICVIPNEPMDKEEVKNKFKIHSNTKYLMFNIQRSFDGLSLDTILTPATLLSQCFAARAEAEFMKSDLSGGALISSGAALPSAKDGNSSETVLLTKEINAAFESLLDSHPNIRISLTPEEGNSLYSSSKPKRVGGKIEKGITLTTTLLPQGTPGVDSSSDLLRCQEVMGPFRRLLGACGGGSNTASVAAEAIQAVKVAKAAARSIPSGTGKHNNSSETPMLTKQSSADKMLEPVESSTVNAPNFAAAVAAVAPNSNSVRAEMLVVPESFRAKSIASITEIGTRGASRKDGKASQNNDKYASILVEWALMICDGGSLGMVGLPMISITKDYTERKRDKERERLRTEAKGAREKLTDCLINKKPSNPEVLMSVYSTLAKLCMHLGLRSDAAGHITIFEEIAASLKLPRPIALSKKFRLDYEEWLADATTPSTTPSQARLKRMQALLMVAKTYYEAARVCGDSNLHRDACKKLMNIYIDISNIPDPLGTPAREMGTREELSRFTDAQIEEYESNDILWMKLFSRARAGVTLDRMKLIGVPITLPKQEIKSLKSKELLPDNADRTIAEGDGDIVREGPDIMSPPTSARMPDHEKYNSLESSNSQITTSFLEPQDQERQGIDDSLFPSQDSMSLEE